MQRHWGRKKFQRGIICATAIHGGSATGSVKLGPSWQITQFSSGVTASCSVTFNIDGSISVVRNQGGDVLPATDNWWTNNPETNIGASYDVRYTAIQSGQSWSTAASPIDVWVQINIAQTWTVRVLGKNTPDVKSANAVTFEIRATGGGAVLDSITGCAHSAQN